MIFLQRNVALLYLFHNNSFIRRFATITYDILKKPKTIEALQNWNATSDTEVDETSKITFTYNHVLCKEFRSAPDEVCALYIQELQKTRISIR